LATALLAHRHPSLLAPVLAAALPWHALGARRRPPQPRPRPCGRCPWRIVSGRKREPAAGSMPERHRTGALSPDPDPLPLEW